MEREADAIVKMTDRMWTVEQNRKAWLAAAKRVREMATNLRALARAATEGGAS